MFSRIHSAAGEKVKMYILRSRSWIQRDTSDRYHRKNCTARKYATFQIFYNFPRQIFTSVLVYNSLLCMYIFRIFGCEAKQFVLYYVQRRRRKFCEIYKIKLYFSSIVQNFLPPPETKISIFLSTFSLVFQYIIHCFVYVFQIFGRAAKPNRLFCTTYSAAGENFAFSQICYKFYYFHQCFSI